VKRRKKKRKLQNKDGYVKRTEIDTETRYERKKRF
jgi:hypothetical protein